MYLIPSHFIQSDPILLSRLLNLSYTVLNALVNYCSRQLPGIHQNYSEFYKNRHKFLAFNFEKMTHDSDSLNFWKTSEGLALNIGRTVEQWHAPANNCSSIFRGDEYHIYYITASSQLIGSIYVNSRHYSIANLFWQMDLSYSKLHFRST